MTMQKLRIYFYTDTFLPAVDGVVTSILNIKKELEARGNDVYVITPSSPGSKLIAEMHNHIITVPGVRFKRYPQYSLALLPFIAPLKLNLEIPDITHLHTPFFMGFYGLLYAKLNRVPVVGTFHTLFTSADVIKEYAISSKATQSILIKYAWPYARYFYNRCNVVIAPSNATERLLRAQHITNITVVPNSVDLERFNEKAEGSAVRERILKGGFKSIVLYVGRISKEKNIETMIEAGRLLKGKKIKFVLAGTGPAMAFYKNIVNSKGLGGMFSFEGFVNDSELPKYYAASDLFCIPSTFETQGIVSLEAMACNKPVVGADYLALKDLIVNGKNGEKFKPLNSEDCARKIERVLNNLDSYKIMIETAKEYSISKIADRLLNVYSSLLNDKA